MNRIFTLCIAFNLCFGLTLFAQKGDATYAQKAAEIQAKVWGDKAPEFEVKTLPAGMEKESAVIIAEYTNVEQASNSRYKFAFAASTSATRTNRVTTYRERVKINDKAALDDYSSLSYQKSLDRTQGLINKTYNKKDTYIGVKLIKPDGKEVIVNTSEEVLTKNEDKDKQGKLAIPGLEVGDIMDYYTCKVELVEDYADKGGNSKYLFVLGSEYPILSYQLNLQYNSKVTVNYINANKAPEFKEATAANGDKTYSLKLSNLPKYDDKLWTSSLRQYPYIEFNASLEKSKGTFFGGKKKEMSRLDEAIKNYEQFFELSKRYVFTDYKSDIKKYFDSSKEFKAAPQDTLMRILYDKWKYSMYITAFNNMAGVYVGTKRNKARVQGRYAVMEIAHTLFDMEVDFDVLLVSPRTTSSLENVFQEGDMEAMIRINGDKKTYMCFDDVFTQYNEIPEQYQGEDAIVLTPKKRNFDKFEESRTTIPVVPAKENYLASKMNVSMLPGNMQKISIERTVTEGGALRGDQADLMLTPDFAPVLKDVVTSDNKKEKKVKLTKLATEIANATAKAREELADNFKNEISGEFGQDPQNLTKYAVTNVGISSVSPEFSFTGTFEMDNFVKRAGNNYIFEAGKLIGVYNKIDDKQRDRKIDVYMPAARTISYNINIAVPKGYQVKGVDELNQQLKNETGTLSIIAKVNGGNLNIQVNRTYVHNFEKLAQWPKLLEIMDGMGNFNSQKVLFEKI
jgi:hypothetical protein